MHIHPLLAAVALSAVLVVPAISQTTPDAASPLNAPPTNSTPMALAVADPDAPAVAPSAAQADSGVAPAPAGVDPFATKVVANGPVADTPASRALYPPLSRAGRHTKPAGN